MNSVRPFIAFALVYSVALPAIQGAEPTETVASWADARKVMDRYCFDCHGLVGLDADLDLMEIANAKAFAKETARWPSILHALRTHYMPHRRGDPMPPDARSALAEFIHTEIVQAAADHLRGSATLRRLNRSQLRNTLEDLLYIDADFADRLPADDAGYGFDTTAATLRVTPMLLEKYFGAAAEASLRAVPVKMSPGTWSLSGGEFEGQGLRSGAQTLTSAGRRSAAYQDLTFPAAGTYRLTAQLSAQQAGDELARAQLSFAGQVLTEAEVPAHFGEGLTEITAEVTINRPGRYEFVAEFLNDYYQPELPSGQNDRNLFFHGLALDGPYQTESELWTPFLQRYFGERPSELSLAVLRPGIELLASRAYRRPATPEELHALGETFDLGVKAADDNPREGLRALLEHLLTSPSFLFRDERGTEPFHLASWLSFTLWSSMPDDRLFALAAEGQLAANLEPEIRRMLADHRAHRLATHFAAQWWRYQDLSIHRPDDKTYPDFDKELGAAMQEETRRFFEHLIAVDGSLLDILDADYTFVNQRLARHYGLEGVEGPRFRQVSLEGLPRRGVWSHASVLTVTSHPTTTSPVLRGQWVLENLVGLAPPPPPDNVPSLPEKAAESPENLRASLTAHRRDPACASCHDIMDPIGLSLEHFDGIGRWRPDEERATVGTETFFDGAEISDPLDLARYLREERTENFLRNLAHKFAIYASGRGLDWRDEAALERITAYVKAHDHRLSALITAVSLEFAPTGSPLASASPAPSAP